MNSEEIRISAHDGGAFSAYVAIPHAGSGPALILGQYICGVNKVMRAIADDFARQGYFAVVPDMFWRQAPGVQLVNDPAKPDPAQFKRALELNDHFDDELAVRDLLACLQAVRHHQACSGRAGFLGYCLGGRLAWYMATSSDADCAVSYYGVDIDKHLDQAPNIRKPLLMHIAERDALVPPPARTAILEKLQGHPCVSIMVHAGVNHAFALPGGPNFSAEAARNANAASADFLRRHLV